MRREITALLRASSGGDADALDRLMDVVYPELHAIALRYFRNERPDHTLQCTALINEAYLRLVEVSGKEWKDRAHFFGFAARMMRSILVDHARARRTAKRGAGGISVALTEQLAAAPAPEVDVLDVHSALEELERLDALQAHIVELRYFGGLTVEETAEVTGVSRSTVKREWITAKAWLLHRMLTTS
jgi:RNA polymerase sigma factor (TIGR02999 family)